ncbi:50S ribosomal protein L32 [Holospora undulata]|uniref:Large ribosomal subunit protein bL32 n=1 Tax=Holospora undulata HU1 TaxID=1321371 RepID=A0A061JI15_9PROT|nr:50S ribosomal protein L32 [Holospora undulata]ETZ05172.1 50S ribosomal protein L32 [Holospora undulata HU1]
MVEKKRLGEIVAVPKKRTSYSRQRMRRSHDHVKIHPVGTCKNCGKNRFPHHMCLECGYYNGRKVITTKTELRVLKQKKEED